MNAARLYIAAGNAWGIVLGVAAGIYAAGIAAGFAWLFLFGDDRWPDWGESAILAVAAIAGLAIFAGCTALGWAAGRNCDAAGPADQARARPVAGGLMLLAVLVGAGGLWSVTRQKAALESNGQEMTDQAATLADLYLATHRFTGIDVDWPGGGTDGSAVLRIEGRREGAYRLEWQISGQSFRKPLLSAAERLDLAPGRARTNIQIPAVALVDGYRAILSHRNADILVDEPFALEARLIPILSAAEEAALPPSEARNLEQGWSKLIDQGRAEFPVRFFLYGGELRWEAR